MTAAETSAGERENGLSLEEIIEAGLAIAREEGIDALTMRTLARRLGVTPMAIYYYVRNKEALLELVADSVYANVAMPSPDEGPWDERILLLLTRARRELLSYPGLSSFVLHFHSVSNGRKISKRIRDFLLEGGFDAEQAERAYATLHTFMVGRLVLDTNPGGGRRRGRAKSTARRRSASRDRMSRGASDELFEQGLRDILTGFLTRLGRTRRR